MTRRPDTFSRTNDFSFSPSPSSSFASFFWSGHAYYDRFLLHKCVVGCVHVCGFLVPLLATVAASTQTKNVFDAPDNGDSHKYIAGLRIAVRSTRPIRRSQRTEWKLNSKYSLSQVFCFGDRWIGAALRLVRIHVSAYTAWGSISIHMDEQSSRIVCLYTSR